MKNIITAPISEADLCIIHASRIFFDWFSIKGFLGANIALAKRDISIRKYMMEVLFS